MSAGGSNFVSLGVLFLRHRGAFAVERKTLEEIHGAIELNIVRVADAFLFFRLQRFNAANGALEEDIAFLFITHGDDDVGCDAVGMNHFMAGSVILRGSEPEGGTILQRKNALDRSEEHTSELQS